MDLNFESLMIDAAQDVQELPSIDVIIPTLKESVYMMYFFRFGCPISFACTCNFD
jgi:hypothetical protein